MLTSQEQKCNTLEFTPELQKDQELHAIEMLTQTTPSQPILLITPSEIYRQLFQQHLKTFGFDVQSRLSVKEGLDQLCDSHKQQRPFGLVIMGPVSSQAEARLFFDALKKYNMSTMVVVILGVQESMTCTNCIGLPVSSCLVQPFSSRQFHQAVVDGFNGKKYEDLRST
jgi:DNA-binding NtrC family response regulator